jgi:hypothetical protein
MSTASISNVAAALGDILYLATSDSAMISVVLCISRDQIIGLASRTALLIDPDLGQHVGLSLDP